MGSIGTGEISLDWMEGTRETFVNNARSHVWDLVTEKAMDIVKDEFEEERQEEAIHSIKALVSKKAAKDYAPLHFRISVEQPSSVGEKRKWIQRGEGSSEKLALALHRQVREVMFVREVGLAMSKNYPKGPKSNGIDSFKLDWMTLITKCIRKLYYLSEELRSECVGTFYG